MGSDPPVGERERIAELLDSLVMGGIAGDQHQAMPQGDPGHDGGGPADGGPVRSRSAWMRPACSAATGSTGRTSAAARRVRRSWISASRRILWRPLTTSITVITEALRTPKARRLA